MSFGACTPNESISTIIPTNYRVIDALDVHVEILSKLGAGVNTL